MSVLFIVTEHRSYLSAERRRRYDDIAKTLAAAAGAEPRVVHYAEPESFRSADAVVVSGSDAPWAAHDRRELRRLGEYILDCDRPVLGICAGMQLLAEAAGGVVEHAGEPEAGFLPVDVLDDRGLLAGLPPRSTLYQSHTDQVPALPDGFRLLASSPACRLQAIADEGRRLWGTQFHPERTSSDHPHGTRVLENFFALVREVGPADAVRP